MVAQLLKWMWRAWPLVVLSVLLTLHLFLVRTTPHKAGAINEALALVLQLVGGAIVLYSINSNMGVIRKGSLLAEFTSYIKAFPLVKRSLVINLKGASIAASGGNVRMRLTRKPKTIEENVAYLQEQLDDLRRELDEDLTELRTALNDRVAKLEGAVSKLSTGVQELETKLDTTVIGDSRVQLFGVIPIAYGAICAYAA